MRRCASLRERQCLTRLEIGSEFRYQVLKEVRLRFLRTAWLLRHHWYVLSSNSPLMFVDVHLELESKLASFMGTEAVCVPDRGCVISLTLRSRSFFPRVTLPFRPPFPPFRAVVIC